MDHDEYAALTPVSPTSIGEDNSSLTNLAFPRYTESGGNDSGNVGLDSHSDLGCIRATVDDTEEKTSLLSSQVPYMTKTAFTRYFHHPRHTLPSANHVGDYGFISGIPGKLQLHQSPF
jgi:hypothetical protein